MPKAKFNVNRVARSLAAAGPYLLYGGLLAVGALILTWLDYLHFTRTLSAESQLFLIASVFLGLGVWPDPACFRGRARRRPSMAIRMPKRRWASAPGKWTC